MELLDTIGRNTVGTLAYIGGLARLTGRSAYYTVVGPFRGKPVRFGRAVHQAMAVGVEALPILSLITFFIGVILALQAAYELRKFGALHLIASGVAVSMTRELGPLMTAIVVIGRSGSAFAAEIGTMKVTEEIDALTTMAVDPTQFLVTPKFLAMMVMMPCLTTWADAMGVCGGALFGITIGTLYQKRFVAPCDVRTASVIQLSAALLATLPLTLFETEAMHWNVDLLYLGCSHFLYSYESTRDVRGQPRFGCDGN